MAGEVRVALVQLEVSDEEPPDERVERVAALVRAQRGRADVVVLPELWHVGAFALALARARGPAGGRPAGRGDARRGA